MPEHGKTDRTKNDGKGNHGLLGHADVADESERATVGAASTLLDLMRIVRQTGGVWPGNYADDGSGDWSALTQSDDKVLDPPQIVGDQLAYNPAGWNKNPTKVRFTLDASRFIRGFEPTRGARWFVNTHATFIATLTHLDGAEAADKKIFIPGGLPLVVGPGAAVLLWYDNTVGAKVWRPLFASAGGDADAIHVNVAGEIAGIAAGTVAPGDILVFEDIDDGNNKKRTTAQAVADFGGGSGSPDTYTSVNDDDSNGGPIACSFGTCYLIDNDGSISPNDDINFELPTGTAGDKGKSVWFRTRYTNDPLVWNAGVQPGIAEIKPTGSDDLTQAGGTISQWRLGMNEDNIRAEYDGAGNWILG